jgi:hypothetical protein
MTDTMTMTVPAPAHLAVVHSDGDQYRAECSRCGWVSDWQATWVAAAVAGAEHRDTAAGPPGEMDVLMSGMLDLQDDLARVVVWLAENWSADLPIPGLRSVTHYDDDGPSWGVAGAVLMAAAPDRAVLARVAERLGVPVRTDPESDSCGNRYQRAARRFGRVEIEVLMSLDRVQGDDEHRVEVVYDEHGRDVRAECSCGWAGDWHDDGVLAESDGDDHREVVG